MAQHSLIAADAVDAQPGIRRIGYRDVIDALARGIGDFAAVPSHAAFLCLIYPLVGFFLIGLTFDYHVLPMAYPLMAGFALVGPIAAIGLYELSRRREAGLDMDWRHVFDIRHSSSFGAILVLGLILMVIFLAWLATAQSLYQWQFGYRAPQSIAQFASDLFTTRSGWTLIAVGNAVGFLFALAVLVISVVSFPLLLDRDVGAAEAVVTSLRAVAANPGPMALWGLIVAAGLLAGSLLLFFGLAVTIPVLGHATWHLYRKTVDASRSPVPDYRPRTRGRRFAADFPVAMFRGDREER